MADQTVLSPEAADGAVSSSGFPGCPASVWRRFFALALDRLIVNVALFVFLLPLGAAMALGRAVAFPLALSPMEALGPLALWGFFLLADWFYFAWQESGPRGATLGKRLLGLRVTDERGARLTFGRASGRYFAKILSAMPFLLGYVLAFFTKRKQALHDLIAGTLVVRSSGTAVAGTP